MVELEQKAIDGRSPLYRLTDMVARVAGMWDTRVGTRIQARIADACVLANKPSIYGSIFRFDGQASVFVPRKGPCYRCLFPEPTPTEMAPSCDEAGVLGVLPGVVGLVQATEAIKLILGRGEPLVGRLLTYDALAMKFQEYRVRRDPRCAVCGDEPTIRTVTDLEWSCHFEPRQPAPV